MDGDKSFATIVGTGTEDYFGGSYNFENQNTHQYQEFSTAYSGLSQIIKPDGLYRSQQRFGMYRWHIVDPVRFDHDLKVTVQDLGWRGNGKYLPQQSDIHYGCLLVSAGTTFNLSKASLKRFPRDQLNRIRLS
ncbi:MAG: DUF2961 domain-containing protein [Janthinobacterium lividum]